MGAWRLFVAVFFGIISGFVGAIYIRIKYYNFAKLPEALSFLTETPFVHRELFYWSVCWFSLILAFFGESFQTGINKFCNDCYFSF